VIKKPLITPFLITLIFSTFSPITIHSANAATVGTGPCISTVSSDTGVTATTSDNYCVVSFKSTGTTTWTVPSGIYFVDVLVVAGGGAGGTANGGAGGGGGGGQVSVQSNKSVSGVVTIQVGSGGSPGSNSSTRGNDGGQSAFVLSASDSITARGGSAGASVVPYNVGTPSSNGFNGGGGSTWADSATAGSTGVGGNRGGNANGDGVYVDKQAAGGGGGSGGVGVNADVATGGAGGAGTANSFTGPSVTYGGGGGGAKRTSNGGSAGTASGGGGAGGKNTVGSNGGDNTGGGGGGGGSANGPDSLGGSGGSGIVVVKYQPITITTITNKLFPRESTTASATVSSGSKTYSSSTLLVCTVNSSSGVVTFVSTGSCTITAAASLSPSTTASTTFQIVPNITQKLISRTGIQPNALSSFIPPPYLSTSDTYTVTSCVSIVGATGADLLSSTNLSFSLASLLVAPGVITDTGAGKSYTITGTLAQVQAAFSIFKLTSSSGRIMAANSGSIYLRARTNLVVDSATDTGCQDFNDARITLYQYTSDQIRRKNVPQKSGSTP